jgi:hypothetical protein
MNRTTEDQTASLLNGISLGCECSQFTTENFRGLCCGEEKSQDEAVGGTGISAKRSSVVQIPNSQRFLSYVGNAR